MPFKIGNVIRNARGFFQTMSGLILDGQTDDNIGQAGPAILFYRNDRKRMRLQNDAGVFRDLALSSDAESALGVPVCVPVVLARHSNGSIAARFTPGYAGVIRKISAFVIDPVTTAAKLATFTPAIGGVATTGGALALTSANCTPLGAKVDGSAITAFNVFGAADEITVAASAVTAFVEGQVVICLFLDHAA